MESDSGIERREFFRISDRLFMEFREVDSRGIARARKGPEAMPASFPTLSRQTRRCPGSAASPKNGVYAYLEIDRQKARHRSSICSRERTSAFTAPTSTSS